MSAQRQPVVNIQAQQAAAAQATMRESLVQAQNHSYQQARVAASQAQSQPTQVRAMER